MTTWSYAQQTTIEIDIMKKIDSHQRNIRFIFCGSPVTIDKRAAWGNNADNLQQGPNGAFLKMKNETEVSHLVQPNADKTAPVGWIQGDGPGLFHKEPIWVDEEVLQPGTVKPIMTLDGPIEYEVKTLSQVCYNDKGNLPNQEDSWVQSVEDIKKNYVF